MTMKKLLRRRSAMRELLQRLETRSLCDDVPRSPQAWPSRTRAGLSDSTCDVPRQPCPGEPR